MIQTNVRGPGTIRNGFFRENVSSSKDDVKDAQNVENSVKLFSKRSWLKDDVKVEPETLRNNVKTHDLFREKNGLFRDLAAPDGSRKTWEGLLMARKDPEKDFP